MLHIVVSTKLNYYLGESRIEYLAGRWPYSDVVYNSTTMLWACCFNPIENIVDCTNPGNETFQAPPPNSSASATLTLKTPSTMATFRSTLIKIPTDSSLSLNPTASSKPDDRSSSSGSESCDKSSQRTVDIGLGATVGILGSAIVAGGVAYASQNLRVNRRDDRREDRRDNWGDSDSWRGNGPGGDNGPSGGRDQLGGGSPRRPNRTRRGHDPRGDDGWSGGDDPGGGKGPSESHKPENDKSSWGIKPRGKRRPALGGEKEVSQKLKLDNLERGGTKYTGRNNRESRNIVINSLPKRPFKQERDRWRLVPAGIPGNSGRVSRRRSSSKSSSSPDRRRVRPVVPSDPNRGPRGTVFSSSSSSPSSGPSRRKPRPKQRIIQRSSRERMEEIQVVQIRSRNQSPLSRSPIPQTRIEEIPAVQMRPHSQVRLHDESATPGHLRPRVEERPMEQITPLNQIRPQSRIVTHSQNPTLSGHRPGMEEIPMERTRPQGHARFHKLSPISSGFSSESRSQSPTPGRGQDVTEERRSPLEERGHVWESDSDRSVFHDDREVVTHNNMPFREPSRTRMRMIQTG